METQYTGRDHMAAVFGQEQTDRIALRGLQGFGPIMDRVDVSGKEVATQPDKYRYILSSGCQVPDTAALDNVRTFLEAGGRYGKL